MHTFTIADFQKSADILYPSDPTLPYHMNLNMFVKLTLLMADFGDSDVGDIVMLVTL